MSYPDEQENSRKPWAQIRREYLEKFADREGDVESQAIIAAYHVVEIFTALSRALDRNGRYKDLIDRRAADFYEGSRLAQGFLDCLINASFSIYNNLNTLSRQCTEGNAEASTLIGIVDKQVHSTVDMEESAAQPAAVLRACFPLLSVITIVLDKGQTMTGSIRSVEQRFASGANAAASDWEQMVNALYRIVEMMQILVLLTAPELADRVNTIASRFKDEDRSKELRLKLRNGFCCLFELGYLLAAQTEAGL